MVSPCWIGSTGIWSRARRSARGSAGRGRAHSLEAERTTPDDVCEMLRNDYRGGTTGNELDKPPSTGNACPFTYDASSDARNNAA